MSNYKFWIDHFSSAPSELIDVFLNLTLESCHEILEENGLSTLNGSVFESAENRVFGFEDSIIKFYHPGRWSIEALEQEYQFLKDLNDENISVITPLTKVKTWRGIHYMIFKKILKPFNESPKIMDEESVKKMSHLLARIHKTGVKRDAPDRPQFDPPGMCSGCFEIIKANGFLPEKMYKIYEEMLDGIVSGLSRFGEIPVQRIHGDSYTGNIIWKDGVPVFLDFDDFQVGPAAIDVKLLSFHWRLDSLPESMDRKERRRIQQELVIKYYREKNDFPQCQEKLFPLLTAYRDIQFDAWFSSRWTEPGFAENYSDDDITDPSWWRENIKGLEKLLSQ